MSARQTTGFRVTDRDLEIVRWVGRVRFVEARQVARRFSMDERNLYRRLQGLVTLSLLAHQRILHAQPGVYSATKRGLDAAGLLLPSPRVDLRTYRHELVAGWVLIALEREFGPPAVVTERELRSLDRGAPDQPRYAVRLGGQHTRRGLHFPDLAVEADAERPLAIEVELTPKGRARLESILAAYVRARHVRAVRYYLAPAARRGLERTVERLRAQHLFDLRTWEEPSGSTRNRRIAAA